MDDGLIGFERAVAGALDELKVGLLGRPQEFTGAVADLYDPDSAEVAVLYMHCSDELMRPYAEAARVGTADALEGAAKKAELWLRDVKFVNESVSHSVAWGVARGLAAYLGVVLPRDPNGGRTKADEARVAVERARAVLADSGATEADVAVALAAVRALPAGTQGKAGLESALERRLAKLAEEREKEAARRAEEARLRREAEERNRLIAEREVRRNSTAQGGFAPDPKPDPKSNNRVVVAAIAVIACVVVTIAVYANSHSDRPATGSSDANFTIAETKARADEGGVSGVEVRKSVAKYSWEELKKLSNAIAKAKDGKAGLKIAKEYNLVDSDGKLKGDTKTVTLTDGTKTGVRILGFRHDELAAGGQSGISFEFADVPVEHRMNPELDNDGGYAPAMYRASAGRTDSDGYIHAIDPIDFDDFDVPKSTNVGGWERSEMRSWLNSDFLALLPDDLRSCVEPAAKRTNNKGKVGKSETFAVTSTEDRLWLLSLTEVYGSMEASDWAQVYDAEGIQYQLYADQGVTTSNYDFCKKGSADSWWWWLRSPDASCEDNFFNVFSGSGWYSHYAYVACGVAPGFCF